MSSRKPILGGFPFLASGDYLSTRARGTFPNPLLSNTLEIWPSCLSLALPLLLEKANALE